MKRPPVLSSIMLYYRPAFFCSFAYYSPDQDDDRDDGNYPDPQDDDEPGKPVVAGADNAIGIDQIDADRAQRRRGNRPGHGPWLRPGAGVGFSDGPELRPSIALWTRHPAELDYDPAGAFTVNLFDTPERVAREEISREDIAADDHTHNRGYTTIGPSFPHAYGAGGIYVSGAKLKDAIDRDQTTRLAHHYRRDPITPPPVDDTVLVSFFPDPMPEASGQRFLVRRYHGFYGQQMSCSSDGGTLWVVWHPGTWLGNELCVADGEQWRPPRKLWVPDAVRPADSEFPRDSPELRVATDSVFLEQEYALYTAALDVPKQPSGSGEEGSRMRPALAAAEPRRADRRRDVAQRGVDQRDEYPVRNSLNVISRYAPGEISRIKQKFTSAGKYFLSVEEGETLVDALSAYVSRTRAGDPRGGEPPPPFYYLDLIGHSRSRDHILKIGELALTSAVAREQFTELVDRGVLDALQIKAIRLLGCRTAAHPRGEKVVRAIHETTELDVYATRTDLFAVHYNEDGFRPEAELLLADHDVILKSGAGDLPPGDDYAADLPDDDPDDPPVSDGQDGAAVPVPQPPDRFSLAALSDPNASKMSAGEYLWWAWSPSEFAQLVALVYADWTEDDNPLLRADYEVLLPVSTGPVRGQSDVRSFDLFVNGARPRLRVNRGGRSYAFYFTKHGKALCDALNHLRIGVAMGEA